MSLISKINSFFSGNHPLYNGFNNTALIKFDTGKNARNYKIDRSNCARLFRQNADFDGCLMLKGDYFAKQNSIYDIEKFLNVNADKYSLFDSFSQIYVDITETLKRDGFMGIREDYQFYDANKEELKGYKVGKLLLIDSLDKTTHHIFFDDNISDNENCIVDLWDIAKKQRIELKESFGKYLYKVDTLQALTDSDYFINVFNECILRREEDDKQEEDETKVKDQDTYEYLKACSKGEYLERTVFPLLLPAFRILEERKPKDPLNFLSLYLMENKEKVQLPSKPKETGIIKKIVSAEEEKESEGIVDEEKENVTK